jgi:hypothetical protein
LRLAFLKGRLVRLAALAGRKPAASAASRLACRPTFLRKGVRAPQDGLQYTPVVRTEYQKRPSKDASRRCTACQQTSGSRPAWSSTVTGVAAGEVMVSMGHSKDRMPPILGLRQAGRTRRLLLNCAAEKPYSRIQ